MSRFPKRERKPIQRFCDIDDEPYYRNSPTKRKNIETASDYYSEEDSKDEHESISISKYQNIKRKRITKIIKPLFLDYKSFVNKLKTDLDSNNLRMVFNENCVQILFDGYSIHIEPMVNLTGFQLSLLDKYNKYIELRDIGFADSIKQYLDYDKLVDEIIRINNLDYNIECYNQENILADKLVELKYTVDNTRELYVTIHKDLNDCNIVISYPHNIIGNRGIKYGDPLIPYRIKTDFENIETFKNVKFKIGLKQNYFDSLEDLINYLNKLLEF